MKNYETIKEAVKDLRASTGGHNRVFYFVNGRLETADKYRESHGAEKIYRSGLCIYAEKQALPVA